MLSLLVLFIGGQSSRRIRGDEAAPLRPIASAAGTTFFVAPDGHDTATGQANRPWRTLAGASNAIRKLEAAGRVPPGGITVIMHSGTYYLQTPLILHSWNSGSAAAPIRYVAAAGENVVVSGGTPLRLRWRAWKHGIMRAQVPAGFKTDQLWVNGQKQILARYPAYNPHSTAAYHGYIRDIFNKSYAGRWAHIMVRLEAIHKHISESYYTRQWPPEYEGHLFAWPAAAAINSRYWRTWKHPDGGIIHVLHPFKWGSLDFQIRRINGQLMLVGGWQTNRPVGNLPTTGYFENFRCYLTKPGEWYLDRTSSTLYFYPPKGLNLTSARVEAAHLRSLVKFEGSPGQPVRYITFRGITFEHTLRTFMRTREPIMRSDWAIYRGGAIPFDGAEHCGLIDCTLEQLGGNAIFLSNYNRNVAVRGCLIKDIGANGVCFVGNPEAAQVPQYWAIHIPFNRMNLSPGPKTNDFPKHCVVSDCLIHNTGQIEYQSAGVEIDLAQDITVRHCSIYHTPRAGINIGDGCWGGDVIEYCDVFNTVLHTGDNGSFNAWGRDRYWGHKARNIEAMVKTHPNLPFLDVIKPIILRDNRWSCNHGWDIDLDDGCSNYRIYNNLCLSGGLKNREGFGRVVRNNVILNNTFYPQVWFTDCGEQFSHNIVMKPYNFVLDPRNWVKFENYNLFPTQAILRREQSLGADSDSVAGNPDFINPGQGDYDVRAGSPAFRIGFHNFPMNEFGVTSIRLRSLVRTTVPNGTAVADRLTQNRRLHAWLGGTIQSITSLAEQSAYGLPSASGVLIVKAPLGSELAKLGLQSQEVVLRLNGQPVATAEALMADYQHEPHEKSMEALVILRQREFTVVFKK
ncbi:MAG: right-handed parallel beta-helix repeat-containing protein [Phycisphaerae bacterium]